YGWSDKLDRTQIAEKYRTCDIVTFVSTYEGFGLPILEGQASGRAVLTSNLSPMKEVAGQGACLVDPTDVQAIGDGIRKIIGDRTYRETLIAQGLENVSRYDVSVMARGYIDLYRKAHNNQPSILREQVA
ncbi:MAG: glycosyltransferase, partial [Saprospiraceae bacterium]|nr:glycosyltransferase [Saprospiraceae bacterium]